MTRQITTKNRIRDIVLTGITGTASMGGFAYAFDGPVGTGAALGFSFSMLGWTYITMQTYLPKTKYRPSAVIRQGGGDSVLVNGSKRVFLNTMRVIKWHDKREEAKPVEVHPIIVWHPEQAEIKVTERDIYRYVTQGWARQQRGIDGPFAAHYYKNVIRPKRKIACLYRLLGETGCFDTFGPGTHSRLILSPARVQPRINNFFPHSG